MRHESALVIAMIALAGCGSPPAVSDRGVLVPEDPAGNIVLYISNQDRAVDPLDVRVDLDGTPIVRAKVVIGEIHPSYEVYHFNRPPGIYEIRVESSRGRARLISNIEVTGNRWVRIVYGYPPHATEFSLDVRDEPVAWR